ncbi:MAG: 1-acyl-sn-glycerol-3-phosphate acyltransferase [Defluviitaleaceae bacterium]|nr:1-acyl-sn-glycerol-3-phosphate acyltransferase [Defluviitaleaceae bacterium]
MLYKVAKVIAWILVKILFRFKVTGMENIPKTGAFLLCANHLSLLDPIVLAVFMKRQPRFMAKKELFKFRPFGSLLRALGAFPVDRKAADMTAFRTAMSVLKSGDGLLIFSQGTRMKEFENAKGGVALFALKSGAQIVPAGIRGDYRLFSRMHIHVGKPICMEEHQGKKIKTELIEEVMADVVSRVSALCKS